MLYLFIPIWAGLQTCFAYLFFKTFLKPKIHQEETTWFLVIAVLMITVYGFLKLDGIYSCLMYLLMAVLMLLLVFGEIGGRGISLLMFAFLIPFVIDTAVYHLISLNGVWDDFGKGLGSCLAVSVGKMLPLGIVAALQHFSPAAQANYGHNRDQEKDMLLLRQHIEMQQDGMRALEQNYRLQRKSAHEFEHHLQVLSDLLENNEVSSARDYLKRLRRNRSIHMMGVNSHHPVIDVILNQKYQTARENNINMQIQVNDLSTVGIPSDSLVMILTNLLDNAIEACRRVDGCREIFCSIICDECLYLSIRNTSDPVEIVNRKIPTSKQDSLSHGFGLMSVTYVLDQLNAEYTFGYEEGEFHFAAEIELE